MSAILNRSWSVVLVMAAVASLLGCRSEPPDGRAIVERWVEDASRERFSLADVSSDATVFEWSFAEADERELWRTKYFDEGSRPVARGFRIVPKGNRPSLERKVDLDAGGIDRIDVEIRGVRRGFVRLMWAGHGQKFDPERTIRLEADMGESSVFSFELVEHPGWSGSVKRLRLEPTSPTDQQVILAGLRGVRYELDESMVDAAIRQGRRLELDHEVRNGIVLLGDRQWTRRVVVPTFGSLEFFYGLPTRSGGTALEVVIGPNTTDEHVLFSTDLDQRGIWKKARVDLGSWAGDTLDLALRLVGSDDTGGGRQMVYIADPVLLEAKPRDELPPNVIVILVDTLRADRVSFNGYERPTTPRIDRWAGDRAVNFTCAIAPSPWTLPSHISLFTGLDAVVHGSNHNEGAPPGLDLLAEQLRRAGFTTRAVTGGVFLHPRFGLDQGFDGFRYWPSDQSQEEELENGVEAAIRTLEELEDRPYFLFFHTYEVHGPYHEREPYFSSFFTGEERDLRVKSRKQPTDEALGFVESKIFRVADDDGEHEFTDEIKTYVGAIYDSGVSYADQMIGDFLARVEEQRMTRPTLVILTSDHGEALGERGGLASHAYLYDFNVRIPLLISLPGAQSGGTRVERQVRLVDVLPTILDTVGIAPSTEVNGHSLRGIVADPAAPFPGGAWSYASSTNRGLALRVEDRLKLIVNDTVWQPVRGQEELFHLREDPDERKNLAAEEIGELPDLRTAVREKLTQSRSGLLITVENHDQDRASLRLAPVHPTRVKAVSFDQEVSIGHEIRAVMIDIPAGGSFRFRLESPEPTKSRTVTALDGGGASVCEQEFTPVELGEGRRFCMTPFCCGEEIGPDATEALVVDLRLLGEMDPSGSLGSASIDAELRAKLEALGYVEDP